MSSVEFLNTHLRQVTRCFDLIRGGAFSTIEDDGDDEGAPDPPTTSKKKKSKGKAKSKQDDKQDEEDPTAGNTSSHDSPPSSIRSDTTSSKPPDSPQTTVPSTASSPVKPSKGVGDGDVRYTCGGVEWHRIFDNEKLRMIRPTKGETAAKPQTQSRSEFMSMLYLDAVDREEVCEWFNSFILSWSLGKPKPSLPKHLANHDHYVLRKLKRLEFLGQHAAQARKHLFGGQNTDEGEAPNAFLNRLHLRRSLSDDMLDLKLVVAAHLWAAFSDRGSGISNEMLEVLTKLDMEFDAQRDGLEVDWVGIHSALSSVISAGKEEGSGENEQPAPAAKSTPSSQPKSQSSPSSQPSSASYKAFSPGFLKRAMTSTTPKEPPPKDLPKVTHPGFPWRLAGPPNPHKPIYYREIPLDADQGIDAPPIQGLQPPPPPEVLAAPGISAMFSMPSGWAVLSLERVKGSTDVGRVTIAPSIGVFKDGSGCLSLSGNFALGAYRCPCRACRAAEGGVTSKAPSSKAAPADKPAKKTAQTTAPTSKQSKSGGNAPSSDPIPAVHSDAGQTLINAATRSLTGNSLFDEPLRLSVGAAMVKLAMDRLELHPDRDVWPLVPTTIPSSDQRSGISDIVGVLLGGPVDRIVHDRCVTTLEQLSKRLKALSTAEKIEVDKARRSAKAELLKHPLLNAGGPQVEDTATALSPCDSHSKSCRLRKKLLVATNDERERRAVYDMVQAGHAMTMGSSHTLRNVKLQPPAIVDLTCVEYSLVAWKPFKARADGQASFERGVRACPLAFRRYDARHGWRRSWQPFEAHDGGPGPDWIRVYLEDVLDSPGGSEDDWAVTFKWAPVNHFLRHVKPGSSADRWLAGFEENPALEGLFGEGRNGERWATFDGAEVATFGGIVADVEGKERWQEHTASTARSTERGERRGASKEDKGGAAKEERGGAVKKEEQGGAAKAPAARAPTAKAPAAKEEPPKAEAETKPPKVEAETKPKAKPPSKTEHKPGCTCRKKEKRKNDAETCSKHKEPKLKGKAPQRRPKSAPLAAIGPSTPSSRAPPKSIPPNGPASCTCGGLHEDGSRGCGSRPLTAAHLREKEAKLEERARLEARRRPSPAPPLLDAVTAKERLLDLRDDLVALLGGKELPLNRAPDSKCAVGTALWLLDSLTTLSQSHSFVIKGMRVHGEAAALQSLEMQMEEAWGKELIEGISRSVELVALARDFLPLCRDAPDAAAQTIFSRWIQPVAMTLAGRQMRAGNDFTELMGCWEEVAKADDGEERIAAMVRLTQLGELHRLAARLDALGRTLLTPEVARNPHEVRMVALLLSGGLKMLFYVNQALTRLPADIVLTKTQYRRWARKRRAEEGSESDSDVGGESTPGAVTPGAVPSPVPPPPPAPQPRPVKKQEKLHKRRSAGKCRMPLVKSG